MLRFFSQFGSCPAALGRVWGPRPGLLSRGVPGARVGRTRWARPPSAACAPRAPRAGVPVRSHRRGAGCGVRVVARGAVTPSGGSCCSSPRRGVSGAARHAGPAPSRPGFAPRGHPSVVTREGLAGGRPRNSPPCDIKVTSSKVTKWDGCFLFAALLGEAEGRRV